MRNRSIFLKVQNIVRVLLPTVYLDDIFVYSNSIEEHEKHLELVFDKLRQAHLYLEESKLDLYSK